MHASLGYRITATLIFFATVALTAPPDARAIGQLDPEFAGGAGFASFQLSTGERPYDYAFGVMVDSSDRILLTGFRSTGVADNVQRDAVVMRLLTDGSFDTNFNGDGMFDFALLPNGLEHNLPAGCALQPDGSLVVFGSAMNEGEVFGELVLARVLADASLDPDFGDGGMAIVPLPEDELVNARISAVRIDNQGRIVIAGYATNLLPRMGPTIDMLAIRLLTDGSFDPEFGTDGIRVINFDAGGGDFDYGLGLSLPGDGSMLLVGLASTEEDGTDIAVARLTPNGAPDPTFGENGRILHGRDPGTGANETGIGVTVDALGRIYIAGRAMTGLQNDDAAILRLLSNGTIDTGFGVDGWQVFGLEPPPEPSQDTVVSITLDRHNRAVATGAFLVNSAAEDFDFMVARLTTDLVHYDRFESGD